MKILRLRILLKLFVKTYNSKISKCLFSSLFFFLSLAKAENYRNSDLGFNLSYPEHFEKLPSKFPFLLILKKYKQNYPKVTFLVITDNFSLEQKINKLNKKLLDSYFSVGLSSAKIISSKINKSNLPFFSAHLSYQLQKENFHSLVAIIPKDSFYLVLTLVSKDQIKPEDYKSFNTMTNSFYWLNQPNSVQKSNNQSYLTLIATISILLFLLVVFIRKKNKT